MIILWVMDWQAIFWITLWKRFFVPTVTDGWESIEERLCIFSVSLFWYEFFIDKYVSNERVIENDEEAE